MVSGISAKTSGDSSIDSGISVRASGVSSMVSGISAKASGASSMISGISARASGVSSMVSEISAKASGDSSIDSGISTAVSSFTSVTSVSVIPDVCSATLQFFNVSKSVLRLLISFFKPESSDIICSRIELLTIELFSGTATADSDFSGTVLDICISLVSSSSEIERS